MTNVVELFFDKRGRAERELNYRLAATGMVVAPATAALGTTFVGQVAKEIVAFLELPVDDLLRSAWDKQQLVREALDQTRGRPGAAMRVTILQHTLTSTYRPRVQLDIDGRRYRIVDLVLTISLEVDSLVVEVREGRVERWGPGTRPVRPSWVWLVPTTTATSTSSPGPSRGLSASHPAPVPTSGARPPTWRRGHPQWRPGPADRRRERSDEPEAPERWFTRARTSASKPALLGAENHCRA